MKLFWHRELFGSNPKLIDALYVIDVSEINPIFEPERNLLVPIVSGLYAKPTEKRPFALEKL
ncbi:hypothetical protein NC99_28200 [Sunxiuqinia dokdonensis]|uniref:Uncharacterized protein n=1 Tax=Sunxiuqinia dokdonensis TaxID=1409788 RepID=A0A0L8V7P3_9BACT|nr:hypothetical protein NC99_28200 [Sunxiuqinia dokdonensis]